jgi:PUA-domain protein
LLVAYLNLSGYLTFMKVKSRHHLKGSEARRVVSALEPFVKDAAALRKASLEMTVTDDGVDVVFVNGRPLIMIVEGQPFFTVQGAIDLLPQKNLVVVDSGAVKHIANGADIMSPGIVTADPDIKEGDLVIVMEEKHRKPLAIGRAMIQGTEMHGSGKAVKSLHHVGDEIWKGLES